MFFLLFFQVTGKQVLPIYLKVVESSYFNSSDKVNLTNINSLFFKKKRKEKTTGGISIQTF